MGDRYFSFVSSLIALLDRLPGNNDHLSVACELVLGFPFAFAFACICFRSFERFAVRGPAPISCWQFALLFACVTWYYFLGLLTLTPENLLELVAVFLVFHVAATGASVSAYPFFLRVYCNVEFCSPRRSTLLLR